MLYPLNSGVVGTFNSSKVQLELEGGVIPLVLVIDFQFQ